MVFIHIPVMTLPQNKHFLYLDLLIPASHKPALVTTIMFEIIYHMTADILVTNRSSPTFEFIYINFVFRQLFHLYSFRVLPFVVTASKINLICLTKHTWDKEDKPPKWFLPIRLEIFPIYFSLYLLVVLYMMAETYPTRCV